MSSLFDEIKFCLTSVDKLAPVFFCKNAVLFESHPDRLTIPFRYLIDIVHFNNITRIGLVAKGPKLKLTIRDNGKGIEEEQIKSSDSFGLIGMRERARYLGGELKISGIPNKGTTIRLEIPIKSE